MYLQVKAVLIYDNKKVVKCVRKTMKQPGVHIKRAQKKWKTANLLMIFKKNGRSLTIWFFFFVSSSSSSSFFFVMDDTPPTSVVWDVDQIFHFAAAVADPDFPFPRTKPVVSRLHREIGRNGCLRICRTGHAILRDVPISNRPTGSVYVFFSIFVPLCFVRFSPSPSASLSLFLYLSTFHSVRNEQKETTILCNVIIVP